MHSGDAPMAIDGLIADASISISQPYKDEDASQTPAAANPVAGDECDAAIEWTQPPGDDAMNSTTGDPRSSETVATSSQVGSTVVGGEDAAGDALAASAVGDALQAEEAVVGGEDAAGDALAASAVEDAPQAEEAVVGGEEAAGDALAASAVEDALQAEEAVVGGEDAAGDALAASAVEDAPQAEEAVVGGEEAAGDALAASAVEDALQAEEAVVGGEDAAGDALADGACHAAEAPHAQAEEEWRVDTEHALHRDHAEDLSNSEAVTQDISTLVGLSATAASMASAPALVPNEPQGMIVGSAVEAPCAQPQPAAPSTMEHSSNTATEDASSSHLVDNSPYELTGASPEPAAIAPHVAAVAPSPRVAQPAALSNARGFGWKDVQMHVRALGAADSVTALQAVLGEGEQYASPLDEAQRRTLQYVRGLARKGEVVLAGWPVVSINEWGMQQERVLVLTSMALYRVAFKLARGSISHYARTSLGSIRRLERGPSAFKVLGVEPDGRPNPFAFMWGEYVGKSQGVPKYERMYYPLLPYQLSAEEVVVVITHAVAAANRVLCSTVGEMVIVHELELVDVPPSASVIDEVAERLNPYMQRLSISLSSATTRLGRTVLDATRSIGAAVDGGNAVTQR